MTRKLRRNYSLSVVAPFIAVLILSIAAAVLAQTSGAVQTAGKANAVLAPAATSALAQAERPLSPWTGAGSSPVGRPHTKRHGARPMDLVPVSFLPVVTYGTGAYWSGITAVGDVNGDGKPDIVVSSLCAASPCDNGLVSVLLGNGDGTFQPALLDTLVNMNPGGIAIADVNGDGKPDLVVALWYPGGAAVLLGNGDGTFQMPVIYGSGGGESSGIALADLNGDGKLDVLVTNWSNSTVGVLLGNGDGTFQPVVTYISGGVFPGSVVVADVNGDGKPDIVVANTSSNTIGVLLGNGDGTFQPAVTYGSGGTGLGSVAVADVNGDDKWDIVVANGSGAGNGDGLIGVLLGNGDGTFQPAVTYDSGGTGAGPITIADLNGDGILDLAVDQCSSSGESCVYIDGAVSVLLGNGDGTFQPAVTFGSGGGDLQSIVAADLNGDGNLDLVVGEEVNDSGGVGVLMNSSALRTPTTATLASSPNPSALGQAVTFTATVSAASGTPTGTVVFSEAFTILGSATLVNGSASISVSSLTLGSHSITAAYQGSLGFVASTSAPLIQVVNPTTTTSLWSSAPRAEKGERVTYTAQVSSSSGGAVTGTVTFQDETGSDTVPIYGGNYAQYTKTYAHVRFYHVTATYSGDANHFGSVSPVLIEDYGWPRMYTALELTSSENPSMVGQPLTFTATVYGAYGPPPDGSLIGFYDDKYLMAQIPLVNSTAVYTTTIAAGKSDITARYQGSEVFLACKHTVVQVVDKYATTNSLTSSPNPSQDGETVTFTAQITNSGGPTPTGTVQFYRNTVKLATGTLDGNGVATFATSGLKPGTCAITAEYEGDSYNAKSASGTVEQVITSVSRR